MKENAYFPHFLVAGEINCYKVFAFNMYVSIEKKNPLKRDQALSDATNGQRGKNLEPCLYLYLYLNQAKSLCNTP